MSNDPAVVRQLVGVADPNNPAHVLKPQADGSLNVNATVSATIGDFAMANAADPSWTEGALVEASVDLSGHQRVKDAAVLAAVSAATVALGAAASAASVPVVIASDQAALPLPTGAATAAKQPSLGIAGTPSANVISVQGVAGGTVLPTQTSFLFQNITTSTTTVVKSGAGVLRGVTVNALGSVASTVTIYDNTAGSGTKIGTINSLALSGQFEYDIAFATGLTIVTTGGPDITVSYR